MKFDTVVLLVRRVLGDSITRYIGRSVCRSVTTYFFDNYWRHLNYCSYPNAQVSLFLTAPAHPHATSVAVYLALFHIKLFPNLKTMQPFKLKK